MNGMRNLLKQSKIRPREIHDKERCNMDDLVKEIYEKLVEEETWGGLEEPVFEDEEDLQAFLDTLDSYWYASDFDFNELKTKIHELFLLHDGLTEGNYYARYLQLADNRVLWECETANDEDLQVYQLFVNKAISDFEKETGVEIFLLGRNSRHVCVKHTYENALKYQDLVQVQQRLEKQLIKDYNEEMGENT